MVLNAGKCYFISLGKKKKKENEILTFKDTIKKKYNLSDFKSLLQIKDICSHHKNIQNLMIEMFKIKNQTAPPIMDSMFERRIFNNF